MESTMQKITVELDTKSLAAVDQELARIRVQMPGEQLTRSDAIRSLILEGITHASDGLDALNGQFFDDDEVRLTVYRKTSAWRVVANRGRDQEETTHEAPETP